jgi:hypothetical protein
MDGRQLRGVTYDKHEPQGLGAPLAYVEPGTVLSGFDVPGTSVALIGGRRSAGNPVSDLAYITYAVREYAGDRAADAADRTIGQSVWRKLVDSQPMCGLCGMARTNDQPGAAGMLARCSTCDLCPDQAFFWHGIMPMWLCVVCAGLLATDDTERIVEYTVKSGGWRPITTRGVGQNVAIVRHVRQTVDHLLAGAHIYFGGMWHGERSRR